MSFEVARVLLNLKLFKPGDLYLVRRLVPFKFNAPQMISVVSDSVMSNVLGRIVATSPTMTAGIPKRLKLCYRLCGRY